MKKKECFVDKFFGKRGIDEEKIKELFSLWKKWSRKVSS